VDCTPGREPRSVAASFGVLFACLFPIRRLWFGYFSDVAIIDS